MEAVRERLHPTGTVDYQVRRDNNAWSDHRLRALTTGAVVASLRPGTVMDPACGDASIVRYANDLSHIAKAYLADISRPNVEALSLAVVNTIRLADIWIAMRDFPLVDVVILTEILEHLDDPDAVLKLAKRKGRHLVASSPEMRPGQVDVNPEHLWMFDAQGYREMLEASGWEVTAHATFSFSTEYDFGVWVCR